MLYLFQERREIELKKVKKLLTRQMELLAEKSKDCEAQDLSNLTKDMLNISFELRQTAGQKKAKGEYDGEIRIKTRVDNSEIDKTMKKLKKASALADELAKKKRSI